MTAAVMYAKLPASVLRELAYLAEQREAEANPWAQLPEAARDEALRMLCEGRIPALGWWTRHLPKRQFPPGSWPAMPPPTLRRQWAPWELVAAAVGLSDDGVSDDVASDVLADLAQRHGLGADALADALFALADRP